MKRIVRTVVCLVLAVMLLMASAALADVGDRYRVTASRLNVRYGAGTEYSVRTVVSNGEIVKYQSAVGNWWKVQLPDNSEGYVDSKYLTFQGSVQGTGYYTVTAKILNIRASASQSSGVVGGVDYGTKVYVSQTNGNWGYIGINGVYGWVSMSYLKAESPPTKDLTVGKAYKVSGGSVNVRSGAGTSYSQLDSISEGTAVIIAKKSGNWAYVGYVSGGYVKQGWVSMTYIG